MTARGACGDRAGTAAVQADVPLLREPREPSTCSVWNILFGGLQQQTAAQLGGISEALVLGGQSAGGAIGNAISPGNVILGTTAAGIVGREGDVLRVTIPWVAAVGALVGLAIVLLNAAGLLGVA